MRNFDINLHHRRRLEEEMNSGIDESEKGEATTAEEIKEHSEPWYQDPGIIALLITVFIVISFYFLFLRGHTSQDITRDHPLVTKLLRIGINTRYIEEQKQVIKNAVNAIDAVKRPIQGLKEQLTSVKNVVGQIPPASVERRPPQKKQPQPQPQPQPQQQENFLASVGESGGSTKGEDSGSGSGSGSGSTASAQKAGSTDTASAEAESQEQPIESGGNEPQMPPEVNTKTHGLRGDVSVPVAKEEKVDKAKAKEEESSSQPNLVAEEASQHLRSGGRKKRSHKGAKAPNDAVLKF